MYYNIAPDIIRKRLIIEGRYTVTVDSLNFLYNFLIDFTKEIRDGEETIKGIRGPFVFEYNFQEKVHANSSYDGVVIWNENQVSSYIWSNTNFFTVDIKT